MNFATKSNHVTPSGIAVSIARTLLKGDLDTTVYEGSEGVVATWWGGACKVHRGDRIRHFPTCVGLAIESVDPAASESAGGLV